MLVARGDANGFEPLDSEATLRRFAALRAIVARAYVYEKRIGRFALYRRAP